MGIPTPDAFAPFSSMVSVRDDLSDDEHDAIMSAAGETRSFEAGSDLVEQGDRPRSSTLVVSGMTARYSTVEDGGRQITGLHIAGDFVDLHSFPLQLMDHGIEVDGGRLAYVVMNAELTLLVCSGGLRGKQQTYALLDELVPTAPPLPREEAVASIVLRYFTSHGPSTIADFTWWSGLTVSDARQGLESAGSRLQELQLDGHVYWSAPSIPDGDGRSPAVDLLQAFDEYIVGYGRTRSVLDADGLAGGGAWNPNTFLNPVIVDGQVIGGWRRAVTRDGVSIETKLLRPLRRHERDPLEAAVDRYGAFLEMPATLA